MRREPWEPPQPFDENTYAFPNRMFARSELLGYIEYCRGRVRRTLDTLTEATASRHTSTPVVTRRGRQRLDDVRLPSAASDSAYAYGYGRRAAAC